MTAWERWASFGGVEIVNTPRAYALSQNASCPAGWIQDDTCGGLHDALGDLPYGLPDAILSTPWYDPTRADVSTRFYGVAGIRFSGLGDSTRAAEMVENSAKGGTLSRPRGASRQVGMELFLLARGGDAMDYGMAWLSSVLDARGCGQHGGECGLTDLEFLTDCPPLREIGESDADYRARITPYRRWLHDVATVAGPYQREIRRSSDGFVGMIVELVLGSERDKVYGAIRDVVIPPMPAVVVQDVAYNLVPYPSAEIAGANVTVARNLSTNPSLETDATGWTASASANSGTALPGTFFTSGRTTELAAVGTASMRGRLLGSGGASGVATVTLAHTVTLAAVAERVSIGVWAAGIVTTSGTIGAVRVDADWLTSGDALISTIAVGIASGPPEHSGKAYSIKSQKPPATAAKVRVRVSYQSVSWSSSSDIRFYADALSVTVP